MELNPLVGIILLVFGIIAGICLVEVITQFADWMTRKIGKLPFTLACLLGSFLLVAFIDASKESTHSPKSLKGAGTRMERALPFHLADDLLLGYSSNFGRPMTILCGSFVHPSVCNDGVKERAVTIKSGLTSGSGGIIYGYRNAALIATAKHVVWDEDTGKIKQSSISSHDGNSFSPQITCVSKRSFSPTIAGKPETDLAFVFAKSRNSLEFPAPIYLKPKTAKVNVAEYAGNSPNTVQTYIVQVKGQTILTSPKLWTGASGSVAYSENGSPLGVYIGQKRSEDIGAISMLPEIDTNFLVDVLEKYHCEILDDPNKIEPSEVKEYMLSLIMWSKRYASNQ